MSEYLQVFTTLPSRDLAQSLARELVESGLAACVQIAGPVSSTYRWQGKIENAEEWLCLLKTSTVLWPKLEQRIATLHPYDIPEMVAIPFGLVSERYQAWLTGSLAEAE